MFIQLVGARRLAAAELEGRVDRDDPVVDRVGEQNGERRLHQPDAVFSVPFAPLVEEEGLDVVAVQVLPREAHRARPHHEPRR